MNTATTYTIYATKPAPDGASASYEARHQTYECLAQAEARWAEVHAAGFDARVVRAAPVEGPFWVAIQQPGEGWHEGPVGTWAELHAAASRRVLGAGRTWRVRRADGSIAWEGPAAHLPEIDPRERG
jgi:hypothetical protein